MGAGMKIFSFVKKLKTKVQLTKEKKDSHVDVYLANNAENKEFLKNKNIEVVNASNGENGENNNINRNTNKRLKSTTVANRKT